MSNIHFLNTKTGKHEFCDMKSWVLMHPNSYAALQITVSKLLNAPISFSMYGADGCGYIVADDQTFNDPFVMAHEEGHLELGHYLEGANVHADEQGVLDDLDAEKAADAYAIEKTKDPRSALVSLQKFMDQLDEARFTTKEKYVKCRLDIVERMLAIANMKV